MKRFHARVAVVKALKDAGLYIETKDNPMQIPICKLVSLPFVSFVSFWANQTKQIW